MVVELPLGAISAFVQHLGSEFEVDVDMLRGALLHGRTCNIFHLPTMLKIDLFAIGPDQYDEMEFSRRKAVRVRDSGETLVVKSPEDTVLRKLRWYQDGGRVSDRQWRDVVQVLRVSGEAMDARYLERWAGVLGVGDLLARASAEASGATGR
jgi:hypothetical protein